MMRTRYRSSAFSLIELMVVVAVLAVTLTLAVGPFRDYILMQRLRSVQSQLVTDMAYARSEAISRDTFVQMRVQVTGDGTCYIIYSRTDSGSGNLCDCSANPGSRCGSDTSELKTVLLPSSESISIGVPTGQPALLTISPRTGGTSMVSVMESITVTNYMVETQIDQVRRFRTTMTPQGRVQVCSPDITIVGGKAC
jgi:type IV fimbrial biogenesis protein FimT